MGLTRPRAHQLQETSFKFACRAISTSNVTLSGGAPATVDGVSVTQGDRVLVIGQTDKSQNGIYNVATVGTGSNGTWNRTKDADDANDITAGTQVSVTEGTTYGDTVWKLTTDGDITIGTTDQDWEQASAYGFGTVTVDGTSLVADTVGDTLTVSEGTNISLSSNAGTDTFTIAIVDAPTFSGNVTGGNLVTSADVTTATVTASGNVTAANVTVSDVLRIAQSGSGLRMTNVGAFDNDGSDNFRIFATNDLIIAANGESGTAITIDATNQDVAVTNDLTVSGNVTAGNLHADNLTTANAFVVVGSSGHLTQDTTLTVDPGSNYIGINQTSPEVTLHMTGEASQSAQIRMEQMADTSDAPDIRTRKSRGTAAAPTKNSAGDFIYRQNHERYNGTSWTTVGQVAVDTDGTNADRFKMTFAVSEDGASVDAANNQLQIDGNDSGAITFNQAYKFPTADGSANNILATDGSGALTFTGDPSFTTVTTTGNVTAGNLTTAGALSVGEVISDLIPDADVTRDLGSPTKQWHSVYVGPGSLYINGQKVLEEDSGTIVVGADENQNISLATTGTGDIEFNPGGSIELKGNVVLAAGKTMSQAGGAASEFSAGVKSDSVTSRTADTNLTLSGNGTGVVNVNDSLTVAQNLTVTGNLTINGATTTVSSTNTTIEDALILLVDGQSGAPTKDAGLVIDRGSSTNVAWIWDESADQFVAITTSDDATTAGDVTITDYTDIRVGSATIDDTLTATGNVTGGNLITGAQVVATGNVTGGNLVTSADVTTATVTATGNVSGGNILSSGAIHTGDNGVVRFYDSDSSNYVEFRAQSTVASNLQFKWPAQDGTSGQVIQTDGAGTLSFATASGGGGGASGYQSSTISTHPAAGGDEDLATGPNDDVAETPFESGAQDAFGVSLGTVYDQMEPIGSTTTIDLGDEEAYVGA